MTQVCEKCVLDSTIPDIQFDEQGVCQYCKGHEEKLLKQRRFVKEQNGEERLQQLFSKIKRDGKHKSYDCLIGVSGGVDSSFVVYMAMQADLNPLLINIDNGYDTDIAKKNIDNLVKKTGYDLYQYDIDFEEFKDIQLSFIKASVIDIEMVTDHAIKAAIYETAAKNNIKYILKGNNVSTEGMMPKSWNYRKTDSKNLKNIHKKFGTKKFDTYPVMSQYKYLYYRMIKKIQIKNPLNYIEYYRKDAIELLQKEFDWEDYGPKHFESIFTRFFQTYILPKKFKIDKRKAHLSNLILNNEITRDQALNELQVLPFDRIDLENDKQFVLDKLELSEEEFNHIMDMEPIQHQVYGTDEFSYSLIQKGTQLYNLFGK